jgi:hypothetical protein
VLLAAGVLGGCGSGAGRSGAGPSSAAAGAAAASSVHPSDSAGAAHSPAGAAKPRPLRAGERFATVRLPGGGYTPAAPAAGKDDYRCFLVDPHLARGTFVTGAEVLPGRPELVHHAILFRVDPTQVAAAERKDAASPGQGWTCFGGTGLPERGGAAGALDSAPWLAGWAPGGGESVFGAGTGVRLAAGSRIVLQLHYNLRAADRPGLTDDTRVRLRLAPDTAHLQPLQTMLLVAPVELPCAPGERGPLCDRGAAVLDLIDRFGPEAGRTVAGLQLLCGGNLLRPAAGPTQHCDRTATRPMVVRAVAGHMHLLGRSISVTLDPGRPGGRTLLDRPVWDFDNQRATPLRTPVRVAPGDTLRVTCTHDARLRGMVPELAGEQPRYVTWGEGTSDEMCLGIVLYTRR